VTEFVIDGADGGPLRGEVRTASGGAGRPAVVVCHGFKGFRRWGFFPHIARRLANAGMTAVAFDFSGSGVGPDGETFSEPDRFRRATISNDLKDLGTVVAHVRGGTLRDGLSPCTKLGILGHSRGGGVAVLHAAHEDGVDALVTWAAVGNFRRWDVAAISEWRRRGSVDVVNSRTGEILPLDVGYLEDLDARAKDFDLDRAAGSVKTPWLILHGDADETVPLAEGRRHHSMAREGVAAFEAIRSGSHTFGVAHPWKGSTPQFDAVVDRTLDWFSRYLLG